MGQQSVNTATIILLLVVACERSSVTQLSQWIDLTHEFSHETLYWPTSKTFELDTVFVGKTPSGYYYSAFNFCTAEHGGTHIDAPIHFAEGRQSVDQIPLSKLIKPGIVIDVSQHALPNRDYQISVSDFTRWENQHDQIPSQTIVLLYTGYGQYWPDPVMYMGTAKRGQEGVSELHFPGLSPEAARWLVENRSISAIGLDTPSIDYGQSQYFESHQILLQHNIPVFENVANLDRLPPVGSLIIALPMKIKGGSGGPLRVVAQIHKS